MTHFILHEAYMEKETVACWIASKRQRAGSSRGIFNSEADNVPLAQPFRTPFFQETLEGSFSVLSRPIFANDNT